MVILRVCGILIKLNIYMKKLIKFIKTIYLKKIKERKYKKAVKDNRDFIEELNRNGGGGMMVCKIDPTKGHSTTSKHCDCWKTN